MKLPNLSGHLTSISLGIRGLQLLLAVVALCLSGALIDTKRYVWCSITFSLLVATLTVVYVGSLVIRPVGMRLPLGVICFFEVLLFIFWVCAALGVIANYVSVDCGAKNDTRDETEMTLLCFCNSGKTFCVVMALIGVMFIASGVLVIIHSVRPHFRENGLCMKLWWQFRYPVLWGNIFRPEPKSSRTRSRSRSTGR